MRKNKATGKIIAMLLVIVTVTVFAVFASGIRIGFIENYTYNFKLNILALGKKMGIEFSEPVRTFLEDLPEQYEEAENTPDVEGQAVTDEGVGEEVQADETEIIEEVEFTEPDIKNKKIKSVTIALENAASAVYSSYRGYLLCVSPTSIIAFDKNSKVLWTCGIQMNNPVLKVNGNYFMIAEHGGKKVALFDGKKRLFEAEADGAIKTADLSADGDITLTTEKEYYKGAVIVINKSGERIFAWNSGTYPILDADICEGSRKLAVAFLNTENGADSVVDIFEISNGERERRVDFKNSIAFDVNFLGDVLNVITDNKISGISQRGKVLWESDYSERKLLSFVCKDDGSKLLLIDNNNTNELELLSARGKVKSLLITETSPECSDMKSGFVAYGAERELVFSTASGKQKHVYSAPKEICGIYIIDNDNVVAVYNSGIDFIEFV